MTPTLTTEQTEQLVAALTQADPSLAPAPTSEALATLMQALASPSPSPSLALSDEMRRVLSALVVLALRHQPTIMPSRPQQLECDVWRFQNKKEKWVAFVGLLDGRPYEIFTGLQDDDEGIVLPKSVNNGWIVKNHNADGSSRYDFSFQNRRGYRITVEGLSGRFNKEYWNYAKLISGVLRHRMPVEHVVLLIDSLQLESDTINTWKAGVVRALKKYTATVDEDPAAENSLP